MVSGVGFGAGLAGALGFAGSTGAGFGRATAGLRGLGLRGDASQPDSNGSAPDHPWTPDSTAAPDKGADVAQDGGCSVGATPPRTPFLTLLLLLFALYVRRA